MSILAFVKAGADRWTAPQAVKRAALVLRLLEEKYGAVPYIRRFDPLDELVSCILSQHCTDAVSFPTFAHMKEHFGTYEAIAAAPPAELAEVIKRAGLGNQKAASIQRVLVAVKLKFGLYDLEDLSALSLDEALAWLQSVQGIGPKTASIVMCFAFNAAVVPLDVHVFRVGRRLGLLPEKSTDAAAHDIARKLVKPDQAYAFHMLMLKHGRTLCRPTNPKCGECPLTEICPYFRAQKQANR